MEKKVRKQKKRKKGKPLPRITAYSWQLAPYENENGVILFYLNKLYKGRIVGYMICNKTELKKLKMFMKERKFK